MLGPYTDGAVRIMTAAKTTPKAWFLPAQSQELINIDRDQAAVPYLCPAKWHDTTERPGSQTVGAAIIKSLTFGVPDKNLCGRPFQLLQKLLPLAELWPECQTVHRSLSDRTVPKWYVHLYAVLFCWPDVELRTVLAVVAVPACC